MTKKTRKRSEKQKTNLAEAVSVARNPVIEDASEAIEKPELSLSLADQEKAVVTDFGHLIDEVGPETDEEPSRTKSSDEKFSDTRIPASDMEYEIDEGISFASGKRINTTEFDSVKISEPISPPPAPPVNARSKPSTLAVVALAGFFILTAIAVTGWFVLQYQEKQIQAATPAKETTQPLQKNQPIAKTPAVTISSVKAAAQVDSPDETPVAEKPAAPEPATVKAAAQVNGPDRNPVAEKPASKKKPATPKKRGRARKPTKKKSKMAQSKARATKNPAGRKKAPSLDWNDGLDDDDAAAAPKPTAGKRTRKNVEPELNWDE